MICCQGITGPCSWGGCSLFRDPDLFSHRQLYACRKMNKSVLRMQNFKKETQQICIMINGICKTIDIPAFITKEEHLFEELISKNLILLPAGNGRVPFVTLRLYLLFLNFLESRAEMQEITRETIAEEHTD